MKTAKEYLKENVLDKLIVSQFTEIEISLIERMMEEYANQSKWISVKTEPFINQTILVINKTGDINIAEYVFGFYWRPNTQKSFTGVTHWQPLPTAHETT